MSTRFETVPNQGGASGAGSTPTGSVPGASTGGTNSEGGSGAPALSGSGAASAGEARTRDAGAPPVAGEDAGLADAGAGAPVEDPPAAPDAEAPAAPGPSTPPPPPAQEDVTFGDVFPILVASCGNCHGANAPGNRPRFAQAGNQAASFTATQGMSGGGVVSERIIVRGVDTRDMPPACGRGALGTGACLDAAEAALLQAWESQGAQQ